MCILTPLFGGLTSLAASGSLWLSAIASSTHSTWLLASAASGFVTSLYWGIFWAAVIVFIIVEGLLLYSSLRFRWRNRTQDSQHTRQHPINMVLMIVPALVGIILFVFIFQMMQAEQASTPDIETSNPLPLSATSACFAATVSAYQAADFLSTSPLTIAVTARQGWWDLDYPGYGFFTADDMYVPTGTVVMLQMDSQQQHVHTWWVPQVARPQQLLPGTTTSTWFEVAAPGTYESRCTVDDCTNALEAMPTRVVALAPAEFDQWVQQQQAPVPPPATPLHEQGKALLGTKGCIGCHAIRGINVSSRVGPNLTNSASRARIAGIMPYSQENMRRWLAMPLELKPGSKMPNLNLSDEELDALVAYLDTFK
jgi:cytochrome c oxidase subunit 2